METMIMTKEESSYCEKPFKVYTFKNNQLINVYENLEEYQNSNFAKFILSDRISHFQDYKDFFNTLKNFKIGDKLYFVARENPHEQFLRKFEDGYIVINQKDQSYESFSMFLTRAREKYLKILEETDHKVLESVELNINLDDYLFLKRNQSRKKIRIIDFILNNLTEEKYYESSKTINS
jgi:hypothetical protein